MSTRVEILTLAFTIFGLFGLGFWLVMFRLWISRFVGLQLARLLLEGMGVVIAFVLGSLVVQAVSLIWSGESVDDLTRAGVIVAIGIFSWIQVSRFTWWWLGQTPQDDSMQLGETMEDPDDLG